MPKTTQAATIADVARLAGVSIATVSRVLNGTTVVVGTTAGRVQAAIDELRYVPRAAARVLASRKTNTLGLLLPEISGAFFSPLLRGIEAAAREAGFDLLVHATEDRSRRPGTWRPLGEHNTDGLLIFTDSLEEAEIRNLNDSGLPVVLMHQRVEEAAIPVVTVENKDGAREIVSHLIEVHGRRRIAFLRGPERQEDSAWRERGYREALETHGLEFDPGLIAYGGFDREIGERAVRELLESGRSFDAVFGGDDEAALGSLAALQAAGRRIPEEVAVVGFDDLPFAPFLNPPLTTVRAPTEQVGREAVRQLLTRMRGEAAKPLTLLPTKIILRNSCGCG